jgi:hypothetical protein
MLNNFAVNLTHSTDDPDHATVAMVVANAAVASGKQKQGLSREQSPRETL